MSKVIFDNEHFKSTYLAEKHYILNHWTGKKLLTNKQFQEAMLVIAEKVLDLEATGILIDTLEFNLTISPELQEWYDKEIVPKHLKAGIKKMAFLLPKDFFAQVSIEQTMEEEEAQAQKTKYFETYEAAEKWLLE